MHRDGSPEKTANGWSSSASGNVSGILLALFSSLSRSSSVLGQPLLVDLAAVARILYLGWQPTRKAGAHEPLEAPRLLVDFLGLWFQRSFVKN